MCDFSVRACVHILVCVSLCVYILMCGVQMGACICVVYCIVLCSVFYIYLHIKMRFCEGMCVFCCLLVFCMLREFYSFWFVIYVYLYVGVSFENLLILKYFSLCILERLYKFFFLDIFWVYTYMEIFI